MVERDALPAVGGVAVLTLGAERPVMHVISIVAADAGEWELRVFFSSVARPTFDLRVSS